MTCPRLASVNNNNLQTNIVMCACIICFFPTAFTFFTFSFMQVWLYAWYESVIHATSNFQTFHRSFRDAVVLIRKHQEQTLSRSVRHLQWMRINWARHISS